jgi:hypothetical protein
VKLDITVSAVLAGAVSIGAVGACVPTPLDLCGAGLSVIVTAVNAAQQRAGVSFSVYVSGSPPAGGVVVCTPPTGGSQLENAAALCAPETTDGECASCLKSKCCDATLEWINGAADAGAEFIGCVDQHCPTACPEKK